MSIAIKIQVATNSADIPSAVLLKKWCNAVLVQQKIKTAAICIRIVNKKESGMLNKTWRGKDGATNVLSFPIESPLLGDLVICAPVVKQEAAQQGKSSKAHWAHMVVHGTLHLLDFDHIKNKDAIKMEALEIKILYQLGFDNPYN